jgi:hypothetical protein
MIEVRLLLARFFEDDSPVVIGAVDRSIWEHWEDSDEDAWRAAARSLFGADPTDYEMREAWAKFAPADLNAAFLVPVAQGEVEPA